ncbi:MAG: phospholipase D family protein [Verrucomicrobia bacterium]|nr:phospholipase D family protein [Verrucomicrobiota bacterium]
MRRDTTRDRKAGRLGAVWLVLLLSLSACLCGCRHLQHNFDKKPSQALAHPEETRLGARLSAQANQHPGQSGFLVLDSNVEALQARAQLAEAAEQTLDVQSYLIWGDRTGRMLAERILDAADRGVRVRILVDDVNVTWKDSWITRLDAHPNVELRVFNPFLGTRTAWFLVLYDFLHAGRLSRRMHNKMFTADNAVSIVGGRNIGDEYFAAREDINFEDLDVLAIGPVVKDLSASFDEYWNSEWAWPVEAWKSPRERSKDLKEARQAVAQQHDRDVSSPAGEAIDQADLLQRLLAETLPLDWGQARVVCDQPMKINGASGKDSGIRVLPEVWAMVEQVTNELIVISPYFVPGEEGIALFRKLRQRGVRIRILTNSLGSTDVALAQTGYARYRRQLLHEGIELYELRPSALSRPKDRRWLRRHATRPQTSLHTKTYVFDRKTVFVGSMNLDRRAYYLNTELALAVESPALAQKIAALFEESIQPQHSYRMALSNPPRVASPKVESLWPQREWPVWITEEKGRLVRHSHEPNASLWRKFITSVLVLLPLEGQL